MKEDLKIFRVDIDISVPDFIKGTGGEKIGLPAGIPPISGISTDSRQIKKGDAFFALKGDKFDGHKFADEAMDRGAAFCVFEGGEIKRGIKVKDCLSALGGLAKFYRKRLNCSVAAVTGSNGKTTVKNMTASILSFVGKTEKSKGSFNNNIGLPLTILGTGPEHEFLVLELGMNHRGEISRLADIACPDAGLITNVGPVHLEFFSGIEDVAQAKGELFEALKEEAVGVVNEDDELVVGVSQKLKCRRFGFSMRRKTDLSYEYESLGGEGPLVKMNTSELSVEARLSLPGVHNASNAAAAAALAHVLGAGAPEIKKGLETAGNDSKRFEIIKLEGGITLVNDCYNSNPVSAEAAIREVASMQGDKILVFADMLELGPSSESMHREMGKIAAQTGFGRFFLLGNFSSFVESGAKEAGIGDGRILKFKSHSDLAEGLLKVLRSGSVVLIKGSRGMEMEKVTNALVSKRRVI